MVAVISTALLSSPCISFLECFLILSKWKTIPFSAAFPCLPSPYYLLTSWSFLHKPLPNIVNATYSSSQGRHYVQFASGKSQITTAIITALLPSSLTRCVLMELPMSKSHYTYKLHGEWFIWRVTTHSFAEEAAGKDLKRERYGSCFLLGQSFQSSRPVSPILSVATGTIINYQEQKLKTECSKSRDLLLYGIRHNTHF